MDFKKLGIVAALVVVAALVAVIAVTHPGSTDPPAEVKAWKEALGASQVEKIDNQSFEIISEMASDWQNKYAPDASGHFKNPKTGTYTMVSIITCASCGAQIPALDMLPELRTAKGTKARIEAERKQIQVRRDYLCPKCGKNAYSEQGARR